MKACSFMILGTSSGVGKSFITAAFCRLFSDWGYSAAPFKAQNMSNNSFVTREGGEIGRAQAVQAECARVEPSIHMNPILLKPSEDNQSQVILHGKSIGNYAAREYFGKRENLEIFVRESYEKIASEYELIVIEGAGSPAEVNLKKYDLVNMRTAEMADARCLLVADIDRGGVFASIIGTLDLLEASERERIDGILINKFRGDQSLFEDGVKFIEERTGKKVWGVLPFTRDLWLDEEDSLNVSESEEVQNPDELDVAVLLMPRLSNFTDFQILNYEPGVRVRYVSRLDQLGKPDLLILPGTKAVCADYEYWHSRGLKKWAQDYALNGGRILGICGGYQMLGKKIKDPHAVESRFQETEALGFFDMTTTFQPEKILKRAEETIETEFFGRKISSVIESYEIHMGTSESHKQYKSFGKTGAVTGNGKILGTYSHGLFENGDFRKTFLDALAGDCGKNRTAGAPVPVKQIREQNYQKLSAWLSSSLNLDLLAQKWGITPKIYNMLS